MRTEEIGNFTQIVADNGYIHKLGTDTYVKAIIMLPSDTILDFEEVAEIPSYTKTEYDDKVAQLVRERYTESEEFAIQRKALNAFFSDNQEKDLSEYNQYNTFVEECKQQAKNPNLYSNGEED